VEGSVVFDGTTLELAEAVVDCVGGVDATCVVVARKWNESYRTQFSTEVIPS
jgi:hypothetical protein